MDVGLNSGIYKFLFVLHLLTVVVGFGSVMLNGIYAARAKNVGGREGVAISEANTFVSDKVAELFIYAVPIFGILLVLVQRFVAHTPPLPRRPNVHAWTSVSTVASTSSCSSSTSSRSWWASVP